jgi:cytochrome bd ubiquinol oxidase subunit II
MDFALVWFTLVTLLWTGFFVLEGFDFGVGMTHGLVGRTDPERRLAIGSIGPLWDGNEVWLIVAGASMFAAFPGWYATMFSGFYPALILLLVALIVRGVAFEYRGRRDSARWRRNWSILLTAGSLLAPLLIGVALGDLLHGVPIDSSQEYTGGLVDLLTPYGLYVGVTVVVLCVLHGSTFLVLKVADPVRDRAHALSRLAAPVAAALVLGFVIWTWSLPSGGGWLGVAVPVLALLAAVAAAVLIQLRHEVWAFTATAVGLAGSIATLFVQLYPRVMVSSTNSAFDLTVQNTASAPYALKVMTVVAAVFLPLVLLYQGWTYYVFRRRLTLADVAEGH